MASETLHLSIVDQRMVRVYTAALLVFPFSDGSQAENAINALTNGLRRTLDTFPFLTGNVELSRDDPESGRVCLRYPTAGFDVQESGLFAWKSIPSSKEFPHTYEQLKRDGMPPAVLTWQRFRPDDLLNYPGIPITGEGLTDFAKSSAPAMRVQATFIPGGLVLSTYVHHSVMDCYGITNFWRFFAKNVSESGESDDPEDPHCCQNGVESVLDQSKLRLQLDTRAPAIQPDHKPSAESYQDGQHVYQKSLADDSPCSLKYFVIPAPRVREYREHLKHFFPEDSPPSICNVLAGLAWTHVTRARLKRMGVRGKDHTRIGIAIDLRRRMSPPMNQHYMGNLALLTRGELKVADLVAEKCVSEETMVTAVREIRRSITKVDDAWVGEHLAFFKSLESIKDTECALEFRFGQDIYVTSWLNFGADLRWGIPGTDLSADGLDGRSEFIRRTHAEADGGMMIMPRRRKLVHGEEAPYELMVRLAAVDMEYLIEEDGGLSRWAERILS